MFSEVFNMCWGSGLPSSVNPWGGFERRVLPNTLPNTLPNALPNALPALNRLPNALPNALLDKLPNTLPDSPSERSSLFL